MVRIVKKQAEKFTHVSNVLAQDNSLHWKSRGIFLYLWSMPDDWTFYETELTHHAPDGRASLRSGLNELEQHGYLIRKRKRKSNGELSEPIWELFENPKRDNPMFENRTLVRKPSHQGPYQNYSKKSPMFDYRMLENQTLQTKHKRQNTNILEREQFQKNNQKNKKFLELKSRWIKIWNHGTKRIINQLVKLSKITNIKLVKFAIEYSGSHCSAYNSSLSYVSKLIHDWKENEIKTIQQAKDYVKGKNKHHNYPKHRKSHRKIIGKLPYWAKPGYHYNPEKNQATPEEAKRAEKIMKKIRAKNL